jgi:uncharacterized protein YwgA
MDEGINSMVEAIRELEAENEKLKFRLSNVSGQSEQPCTKHDVSKSLLIEVLKRYEQWEANMILEPKCWKNAYPELTEELYEELMEIQELRNKALSNVSNTKQQQLN